MRHRLDPRVVALVLLLAPSCGGSSSTPAAPPTPTTTTTLPPTTGGANVTISIAANAGNMSYAPASQSVKVGQTVAWKNNDTDFHTSTANGGQWNTGSLAPGATSAAITMNTAGTFPYHCAFHPGMVATLTVTQ